MFSKLCCTTLVVLLLVSAPAFGQGRSYVKNPHESFDVWRDRECNMQGAGTLCMPLDGTWSVVEFDQGDPPCYQNDDGSSSVISLGFTFDLFGTGQTEIYINNNGNVSFGGPYWSYSPEGFPIADYPMVAPFWGDVDTRSMEDGAGVVWMKQGTHYLAVTWDHVGYYSQNTELQSTFQLVISDGTYEPMGLGNNVCFCFGDMQWTTGDASDGVNGFGGYPATVGVNKGNGTDYFLIGRFDHPGSDYDGPGGNVDGVDYLDSQVFCFNVGAETNQPPVGIGFPLGDLIQMCMGQTLEITVGFIGPEAEQTVHTDVDDGELPNFSYTSTDGNPSTVEIIFSPEPGQEGQHVIHFTATDNYDPPGVTDRYLTIDVRPGPSATENVTWGSVKTKYRKR